MCETRDDEAWLPPGRLTLGGVRLRAATWRRIFGDACRPEGVSAAELRRRYRLAATTADSVMRLLWDHPGAHGPLWTNGVFPATQALWASNAVAAPTPRVDV